MIRRLIPAGGKGRIYLYGFILIGVAAGILVWLLVYRSISTGNEVRERAAAIKAGPDVRVTYARLSAGERTLTFSGEARPYATVTLYAKVSGYLKEIRVDKGDRVKAGQVLGIIESPELDRQYEAGLADARDKRRDALRAQELIKDGYISQKDADHAETAAVQAEANAAALRVQKDYEILRAPFEATVTARFADPGALLQGATGSQTAALPLVNLSKTDRLRVYIYIDQRDAVFVGVGDRVEVSDPNRPDTKLPASVSRLSGELDPRTRTLLAEIDLDNRRGSILAGSFVQVRLMLKTAPFVEIPAAALLIKGDKAFVAVLAPGNRASFRPVEVFDSDGKLVRLRSGLQAGETIILNPGTGIADGEQVKPTVYNAG
ncbi:MAG: efflux RND transporter periplasmic adaptor subunit [Syntrophales bacterium]|nr:efflux RND transporter periplasmic adaptor subunit [Syntrophales bacterium]